MKNQLNKEYTANLGSQLEEQEPSLYQVLVLNDDYTPMEFVVGTLERFFYLDRQKATAIMLEAHLKGSATCGVFSKDVAEAKVSEVVDYARTSEHPFLCSMEAA